MIVGIGLDITALPRIASILERWGERFLQRILTEKERAALPPGQGRRTAWVAGRFAAKEAASKALGTGFSGGVEMRDIEILTMEGGAPRMILHGGAEARARASACAAPMFPSAMKKTWPVPLPYWKTESEGW